MVLNKLLVTTCLQRLQCQLAVVYEVIYYSDCQYLFIYLLISKVHLGQHANLHLQITIIQAIYDVLKSVKVNCIYVINFQVIPFFYCSWQKGLLISINSALELWKFRWIVSMSKWDWILAVVDNDQVILVGFWLLWTIKYVWHLFFYFSDLAIEDGLTYMYQ